MRSRRRLAILCQVLLMPDDSFQTVQLPRLQMCEGPEVLSHLDVIWYFKTPVDESIVEEICQLPTEGAKCKRQAGEKHKMKTDGKMVCQALPMEDEIRNCVLAGTSWVEQKPMLDASLKPLLGEGCPPAAQDESHKLTVPVTAQSLAQLVSSR